MTAYRKPEVRAVDLETAAVHDLLARIKRLRGRVALPVAIASLTIPWVGMAAHATGYWSVLGVLPDGRYVVSTLTLILAAALCAAPVAGPGFVLYVALRARERRGWAERQRANGVSASFLAENVARFG